MSEQFLSCATRIAGRSKSSTAVGLGQCPPSLWSLSPVSTGSCRRFSVKLRLQLGCVWFSIGSEPIMERTVSTHQPSHSSRFWKFSPVSLSQLTPVVQAFIAQLLFIGLIVSTSNNRLLRRSEKRSWQTPQYLLNRLSCHSCLPVCFLNAGVLGAKRDMFSENSQPSSLGKLVADWTENSFWSTNAHRGAIGIANAQMR